MKFKFDNTGVTVFDGEGNKIGRVEQVTSPRGYSGYDAHRRTKGDNFEWSHKSDLSKATAEAIYANSKAPHNLHPLLRYALRDHGINA